ncbi:MAG: hypothetical protein RBR91_12105 [Porticoccaceae bacterium]|jgi:hypothetical protein|nr:hypothetical protein [Porticoccaceae bacterium]
MLKSLVSPVVALLLLALAALLWWPVATLPGLAPGVTLLEGSRPLAGRALLAAGGALIQWRWCPARGPLALCVSVSGAGGAAEARVMPAPGRWQVAAVTFKGLPLAALGLPPGLVDGRLDGTLGDLVARPMGGCLFADTRNARGEGRIRDLRVLGRPLADQVVALEAGGEGGARVLRISGGDVSGELNLGADGRLQGALRLATPNGPETLPINQRLPCAPAGQGL